MNRKRPSTVKSTEPDDQQIVSTLQTKLDISVERFSSIRESYLQSGSTNKLRALIYGPPKTGKTSSIMTLPGFTYIHSFDPGGLAPLHDVLSVSPPSMVAEDFSGDNMYQPTKYTEWLDRFRSMQRNGDFEYIDNYVLDSATFWLSCMMNDIVKKALARPKTIRVEDIQPALQDYLMQKILVHNFMTEILSLPCNFIMFAHELMEMDENNHAQYSILMSPKLAANMPPMFSEFYYTQVRELEPGKFAYYWKTMQDSSGRLAGSRGARFNRATGARTNLAGVDGRGTVLQNFTKLYKELGITVPE